MTAAIAQSADCANAQSFWHAYKSYTPWLLNMAKHKAKLMGLNLYISDPKGDTALKSLGNVAPFEYEDAGDGVIDGGVYEIFVKKLKM